MFCNVSHSNVPYRIVMEECCPSLTSFLTAATGAADRGVLGPLLFSWLFLSIFLARNSIAYPRFRMMPANVVCTSFFTFSSRDIELVASFRSHRSVSHGPRCMATASYESGAVRKMVGLRGSVGDGNARDRRVVWPVRSLRTDLACIRFLPRLQEVRTIDKTRNQFMVMCSTGS